MNNEKKIAFSMEQEQTLKNMENSTDNMYITGPPGTGKTEVLKEFVRRTKKKVVVLAPTGVAALLISGQTIHSFFEIDPKINFVEELKLRCIKEKVKNLIRSIDSIIIDEISMVPPNLIDIIDIICKYATGSQRSFGGKQLICFGDLYQLSPVVTDEVVKSYLNREYGGVLFYRAHAFENTDLINDNSLKVYELTQIFRQNDGNFKRILNDIRTGNVSQEIVDMLNKQVIKKELSEDIITLATTNNIVNNINNSMLDKLQSEEFIYTATTDGIISNKQCPSDEELHLKVGAHIMMTVNDTEKRWVNGTLGVITSLKDNEIKVQIDGVEYSVDKYKWKNSKYILRNGELTQEVVGSFEQYPLKLAWAVTIHKAQGQTYKSVLIDLGSGAFADGQVYVALSRCVSLDTLYLKRPISLDDIKVNREAIDFMKKH